MKSLFGSHINILRGGKKSVLSKSTLSTGLLSGFYLRFFVGGGGKSILKNFWSQQWREKICLGLLGGSGECSPGKF